MDRSGDFLTQCDGAAFGRRIWCDRKGRYSVDGEEGISDFFFHQKSRTADNLYIHLRCKHCKTRSRCPVKAKIKSITGEIMTMRNLHNHLPEFDGHGMGVRTARGNWLRFLRKNPRESPINAVLNERRKLPVEVAAQIKPVSHVTTARRHVSAAERLAQVRSLEELLEFIEDNGIPEFASAAKGQRLDPSRSIKVKGVDISWAWELLDSGLIDPTDFIDLVKSKVENAATPQNDRRDENQMKANAISYTQEDEETNIASRILQHDHDYMLPVRAYDGDHTYTRPPE